MFKLSTRLIAALLFISTSVFATSASDKAVKVAEKKTADYVQVVKINGNEQAQVYKILLAKEQNTLFARQEHKGDKEAFKAATKPFNKKSNRQIKDIIGKDKMQKMNQFYKTQKAASKK